MARILVIDDEPGICRAFEKFLGDAGHEVRVSSRAEPAMVLAEAFEPDLAFVDVRLPGMSGLEALVRLREQDPALQVIVITAFGTMETAVEAMKRGAYDYMLKPLDLGRIGAVIDRALASRRIAAEVAIRIEGAGPEPAAPSFLAGRTPVMQEVFKRIGAVSVSDVSVLIEGEGGTGKEMVARAIHYASARAERPFEPVNCAAIPETLLASEIFGHEEGAFPGAGVRRRGRVESASAGTLFLNEVAEVPPSIQVRLLRLLEERTFERVGGSERLDADVRVISATDADLQAATGAGAFRHDLFYRLNVMAIRVPALRERMADVPLLAARFLEARGGKPAGISKDALRILVTYAWPGNVRELRNAVEHALVLARGGTVLPEHLPEGVRRGADRRPEEDEERIRSFIEQLLDGDLPEGEVYARIMDRFEAPLVAAVLTRTGGNQVQAAKLLGIHRTTLRSKIQKHTET